MLPKNNFSVIYQLHSNFKQFCVLILSMVLIYSCSNPLTNDDPFSNKIIVTEIMYNNGIDSLEYLELKNTSSSDISMKGMFFSGGIRMEFSDDAVIRKGQYFILTNSRDLFESQYPGINIDGIFMGHLNNNGDEIVLTDAGQGTQFDIKYKNDGFWPALSNGFGYSLVTKSENAPGDQNDHNDWCASSTRFGSPGKADNPASNSVVYVNEIITSGLTQRIDQIELYNPSSSEPIDISNWFLTDDPKSPKKFKIPSGISILPNSYKTFTAAEFGNNMAVSINGGSVYIFSASSDGMYTGFSNGIKYEDADPGTSFCLIRNTDGKYFTCRCKTSTIGSANSQPAAGDLVISEIMYHPQTDGTEYIEIINISDTTLTFDSPEKPWRVDGLSFKFPSGMILRSKQMLLLIDSMTPIDRFRTKNNIDSSITILQFSGSISNKGEKISIERPGKIWIDTSGTPQCSFVTVDAVSFKDSSPWPEEADGKGYSLVRTDLSAWGNEPQNWKKSDEIGGTPGKL